MDALIEFANAQPAQRYGAKFAPEVVKCAAQGDAVAIEILEKGGTDLAYLVALLIERMRAAEGEAFEIPEVAFAGGILAHVERVRASLKEFLRSRYAGIQFREEVVDPVRGALWHAIKGH